MKFFYAPKEVGYEMHMCVCVCVSLSLLKHQYTNRQYNKATK